MNIQDCIEAMCGYQQVRPADGNALHMARRGSICGVDPDGTVRVAWDGDLISTSENPLFLRLVSELVPGKPVVTTGAKLCRGARKMRI